MHAVKLWGIALRSLLAVARVRYLEDTIVTLVDPVPDRWRKMGTVADHRR